MKITNALILFAISLSACNSPVKQSSTQPVQQAVKPLKFFDHGTIDINDTSGLKIVALKADEKNADDSYKYLRSDNYYADQFSCVVQGFSYYRLTNIHPNKKTITGCVTKSWPYNGTTVYENVPFTLKAGEWKTFGCFFVTPSQPITFSICSAYGTLQTCACNVN